MEQLVVIDFQRQCNGIRCCFMLGVAPYFAFAF